MVPTRRSSGHERHRRALAACVGAYFGIRVCQVVVGPVVPGLIATFDVSRGTVGLALSGMWVVYALVQLPGGALADRVGERRVVGGALTLSALAGLGMAAAPGFAAFAAAVAVVGAGAGVYYNPATTLLDRTATDVGRAIGVHRVGGQAAGVAAPLGAAALSGRYGWRVTLLAAALTVVVAAGAFAVGTRPTAPRRPTASLRELVAPGDVAALLARPHVRTTTVVMAMVEFAGLAAVAFVPTLLVEHHGLGVAAANLLFALFAGVAAAAQPFAGWLSDRHGRDRTVVALAAAGVLGYAGLAAGGPLALAVPATVLAGASVSVTPAVQSRLLDGLGDDERGTGFGAFRTVYLLVGATGTAVVGAVADVAGWTAAFGVLAGLFVAVLAVTLAAGRPADASLTN